MIRCIKIASTGAYIPSRKVTSSQIDALIKKPQGWTESKTCIKNRYFAGEETASFMGARAAEQALENGGFNQNDIDVIVSASGTMEQAIPCTASLIQRELQWIDSGIPCFDVNSTCLSFVTALDLMCSMIETGTHHRALIVSSDISSAGLDWKNEYSSSLFGDAAAAVIIEKASGDETPCVHPGFMHTYSRAADFALIRGGGTKLPPSRHCKENAKDFLFHMEGKKLFKTAMKYLPEKTNAYFEEQGVSVKDIALVVPHQASYPALSLYQKRMNFTHEQFFLCIEEYGNTVAASIPMALNLAITQGRVRRGEKIFLVGTSAGLSIGGILLEY